MHSHKRGPLVGCSGFGNNIGNYLKRFSTVEYQQTFFNPPKPAALHRLRQRMPQGFDVVIRAWQLITHPVGTPGYRRLAQPPSGEPTQYGHFNATAGVTEALGQTMAVAEILEASAILFETPASFTPTAAHRKQMASFFERAERRRHLIWDPQGIWSSQEALAVCQDLGLTLCSDPLANTLIGESAVLPDGELVYIKLRGLGAGPRHYGETQLIWLASALLEQEQAFCFFNTVNMFQDATRLMGTLQVLREEQAEEP